MWFGRVYWTIILIIWSWWLNLRGLMSLSPDSISYNLGPPETGMSSLWGTRIKAFGIFEYCTVRFFDIPLPIRCTMKMYIISVMIGCYSLDHGHGKRHTFLNFLVRPSLRNSCTVIIAYVCCSIPACSPQKNLHLKYSC